MSGAQEAILTLAKTLSGAGEDEEPLLEALCQAAEQWWKGRLLPGVTAEDCGEAYPCAAAFTAALYRAKSSAANRWARSVPAPIKRKSALVMSAPSPGTTACTVTAQPRASRYRRRTDTLA